MQFSFQKQQNVQSPTTLAQRKPDRPLSAAQLTLNLTKTTSFEDRDDYQHHQNKPVATDSSVPPLSTSSTTTTSSSVVIPVLIADEIVVPLPLTPSLTVDNESAVASTSTTPQSKILNVISESCDEHSATITMNPIVTCSDDSGTLSVAVVCQLASGTGVTTASTTTTFSTTPTINVVCPTGEDDEDINDEIVNASLSIDHQSSMDIDQSMSSSCAVELQQLEVNASAVDGGVIPQEELSPTTDEYQECCPPDDYQYDISTEGEIMAPGCVAPAPTPAPSIAPLAEVEADPVDDDLEVDCECVVAVVGPTTCTASSASVTVEIVKQLPPFAEPIKRKRKKRSSESRAEADVDVVILESPSLAPVAVPGTDTTETPSRNAVCPWEDE